jgi:hypothetical protein
MAIDTGELLAFVLIAVPVGLLGFGLFQARYAVRTGGLMAGLARVITDPVKGRRWVAYLVTILAAFLLSGAAGALEILFPGSAYSWNMVQTMAFVVGAIAILLMLSVGDVTKPLSLSEELHYQEERPELLTAVEPKNPRTSTTDAESMYVISEFPVAESAKAPTKPSSH